ncbi:MAG TPA: histidine kinase [Flavobacteriales bacterium]|jgi:signal transduction histidine kinase|nr:histidine kinase [Flavobacteriales bacterium]
MTPARRRLLIYWTTQIAGWSLLAVLLGAPSWVGTDAANRAALGSLLTIFVVLGVAASHAFRGIIQQRRWLDLSIELLLPRLAFTALVLGLLTSLANGGIHDLAFPQGRPVLVLDAPRLLEFVLGWVLQLFIWSILYFAYHYFIRSRREEIRSLRLETADRDSQLANLRSQLNPHFMFNALNGIRALIDEDPGRAKQAITQLSAILRNAMATVKRRTVPLGEELDIVKSYLALESMRFEERLRVRYDVDPALEREPVPPMMLQTLVENAVRHGVAKRTEGGEVVIGAQRGLNGLVLSVRNSGSYDANATPGTGIGLRNTRERLQRIYGKGALLRIVNDGGMVLTEVEIPATNEHESTDRGR